MVLPIATTGLVGVILDQCFASANDLVTRAGGTAEIVLLKGGIELRKTIENAKIAYADSLDQTTDRVNGSVARVIRDLATLTNDTQRSAVAVVNSLGDRAQEIANALPFHNERPQLRSISPLVKVVTDFAQPIRFNFLGNFEHAATAAHTPTLTFNGNAATLVLNTINRLIFEMPAGNVFDRALVQRARTYSFATGELRASWPAQAPGPTGMGGIVQRLLGLGQPAAAAIGPRVETFRVTIGVLPPSPGQFTVKYRRERVEREERGGVSGNMHLDSCDHGGEGYHARPNDIGGGNKDETATFFCHPPDGGWKFVEGRTSHTGSVRTNAFIRGISTEPNLISVHLETIHKGIGHSGIMDISIHYTIARDVVRPNPALEERPVSLNWGGAHTVSPAGDWCSWKVLFKPFDSADAAEPEERFHWDANPRTESDPQRLYPNWDVSRGPHSDPVNGNGCRIENRPGVGYTITAAIPEDIADV